MKTSPLCRKLVLSGSLIELFEYPLPPSWQRRGFTPEELEERRKMKELYNSGLESPDIEKTLPSIARSRSRLRRLVYSNFCKWNDKNGYIIPPKFLTLTFKENIQDLKSANYHITKFIQRLNYNFRNSTAELIQYVCIPEFQKRGAIHYHLILFNFPFADYVFKRIRNIWGDIFHLKTVKRDQDPSGIARYLLKYITKQATDGRFWGQKRYFASRNIKKPILLRDDIAIELISKLIERFQTYKSSFDVPFLGNISYWCYNLKNNRDIYSLSSFLDPYAKEQLQIADKNKRL